jgi:TRAP-type mannitol/chloroaromatic compound transport system permease small subunit
MVSYLILVVMAIIVWDVAARYVFRSPLLWGAETSNILFGVYFLVGGAYTMRRHAHVNVDIVVSRLSPPVRRALEVVTVVIIAFFAAIMLWQGSVMAWDAITVWEKSASAWGAPIYLVKPFIPLGVLLLLLQAGANLVIGPVRRASGTVRE